MLKGDPFDGWPGGVEIAGIAADVQVEGRHGAGQTAVLHLGMALQLVEMGTMPCFEVQELLGVLLQQIKAGVGRRASQRIGGETVAVPEGQARVCANEG